MKGKDKPPAAVEVRGVSRSFDKVKALEDVTFDVPEGSLYGLIGPDGAGKTTLLRLLCGLLHPDKGDCFLLGLHSIKEREKIKDALGYMPQRFSLYEDLSVAENMLFFSDLFGVPRKERKKRYDQLMKFSRLEPFQERRAGALSGGMKQKLALSCILIHRPKIILLDEPTTGVDPLSRREFWNLLKSLVEEGITIITSTPYMDEAALCDMTALIHKGKILTIKPPDEIPSMFPYDLWAINALLNKRQLTEIRSMPETLDVHQFGDSAHITVKKETGFERQFDALLEKIDLSEVQYEKIEPGIEDVFIYMMGK